jgi:uncharacterized Zn finger protein
MAFKPIKSIQIGCEACGGGFTMTAGTQDLGETLKAANLINCSNCGVVVMDSEEALALANAISAHNETCRQINSILDSLPCQVWFGEE